MKTPKYTQNARVCPRTFLAFLLAAGWLLLLAMPNRAAAQTNDPKLQQQYYIFDHNIDQAWGYNTESSNTRVAIHSMAGFATSHEDLGGSRYLTPWTEWLEPEYDHATEIAGILGAQTNNNEGIAGIDWSSTIKSYNLLRKRDRG